MARLPPLVVLLLAPASLGCADITYESSVLRTTVLSTGQKLVPVGIRADAQQDGPVVAGKAIRLCDTYEVKDVERKVREEPKNKSLPGDLVGLGFGLSIAGLGAGILVDSAHVYSSDRNSRLYNPTGPTAAKVGGSILVVVGAAISAAPIVDLVRMAIAPTKESLQRDLDMGTKLASSMPCGENMPAIGERVTGHIGDAVFDLGTTDRRGQFSVDLTNKIPPERLRALGDPARMQIWVGQGRSTDAEIPRPGAVVAQPAEDAAPKPPPPSSPQVAVSPEEATQAKGAAKAAKEACRKACAASCASKPGCADACAAEACK